MTQANERQIGGSHYGLVKFQHWDWADYNSMLYLEGRLSAYICRYKEKKGVEDLWKAGHFIAKIIELSHGGRRNQARPLPNPRTTELIATHNLNPTAAKALHLCLGWWSTKDLLEIEKLIGELIKEVQEGYTNG